VSTARTASDPCKKLLILLTLLLSVLRGAVHHLRRGCVGIGISVAESAHRNVPLVALSWGELIDKITILEIKQQRLSSADAIANVQRELAALNKVVDASSVPESVAPVKLALKVVNESLWEIEDQIRAKEAQSSFDQQFIALARSIYINNDERAKLKRQINKLMNSELVEEKQYTSYSPQGSLSPTT
jgi:predicted  nucleic acid-binding Zn-ribbon protein